MEKLKVACLYGADGVYFGGSKFNLRYASENLSDTEIIEAVKFAHSKNVRCYALLNSYMNDSDIKELPGFIENLAVAGVDGVIVSDIGVMKFIRKYPEIKIILSTQKSCLNAESAMFWKENGVSRIVLGREISIDEAFEIKEIADIEIEMFVHGAMCMSMSGECLISNYTTGRDANRGGCSHACRFMYKLSNENSSVRNTFMSSKDLNGLNCIPQFFKNNIDALKIEGRMKSPLYLATLVKTYKEAISDYQNNSSNWTSSKYFEETDKIRHRPYTEGFLRSSKNEDTIYLEPEYKNNEVNSYNYAGIVLDVLADNKIAVLAKDRFCKADLIEVLTFSGKNISMDSRDLYDVKENKIEYSKPNSIVIMQGSENIRKFNIVRAKAKRKENNI